MRIVNNVIDPKFIWKKVIADSHFEQSLKVKDDHHDDQHLGTVVCFSEDFLFFAAMGGWEGWALNTWIKEILVEVDDT